MKPLHAVAVAFTTQFMAMVGTLGPISLSVQPIAESTGASLAEVGSGASLIFLMMAASGLVVGRLLDRGYARQVMLLGGSGLGLALLGLAQAEALWSLALGCVAIGACIPMLGPVSGAALVGKVVTENRGRALGIMNVGAPAGTMVGALVAGLLIEDVGWRSTYTILGTAIALVIVPLVAVAVPRRVLGPESGASDLGMEPGKLLRTRDFLLIGATQGVGAGVAMGWAVHLAPYLQALGADTTYASRVIGAGSGLGVLGGLLFGMLNDRHGPRLMMLVVLVLSGFGYSMLSFEPVLTLASITALGLGLVGGGLLPTYALLLARRFGADNLGRAFGLTNLFMLPLGLGLPPLVGLVVERTGSYGAPLFAVSTLFVLAAVGVLQVRGPLDRV